MALHEIYSHQDFRRGTIPVESRVHTPSAFSKTFHKGSQTRRYAILPDANGWRVVEATDSVVIRDHVVTDWHRVERARRSITIEMSALRAEGWTERG